jgi:hypothetical protein
MQHRKQMLLCRADSAAIAIIAIVVVTNASTGFSATPDNKTMG